MKGYLIATTADPVTLPVATSEWLARCLIAYSSCYRLVPSWQAIPLTQPIKDLDWGQLWQTYTTLRGQEYPVVIVHAGSLGEGTSNHCTLADLAKDWQIPVLLTVPITLWTLSQTVAFCALARHAGALVQGIVLFRLGHYDLNIKERGPISGDDLTLLQHEIQTLAQVRVLGCLSLDTLEAGTEEVDWARLASTLDLESLGVECPQLTY